MQIQITGKHMDLGGALRSRIEEGLEAAVSKYFNRTGEASVFVSQHGHLVEVDCNVHLPSGIVLQSTGKATDPYAALEDSLDKMEKRVRRYKRRLKDHHRDRVDPVEFAGAPSYILAGTNGADTEELEPDSLQPMIIAEMEMQIPTLSVGEAVMQMELAHAPLLVFRNEKSGGVNVVHRRDDGNIGWIDPAHSR